MVLIASLRQFRCVTCLFRAAASSSQRQRGIGDIGASLRSAAASRRFFRGERRTASGSAGAVLIAGAIMSPGLAFAEGSVDEPDSGRNDDPKDGKAEQADEGLRSLYPPIEPYKSGHMRTHDGKHALYFEECGNPNGQPVLFLHGGPAAGISSMSRRFFDPEFYRIVLLDQRGAGKSTPNASLENNTTWHLVDDLDHLRRHLGISRWHMVFGGSWGSTLGLAYSQKYPRDVASLVLRGIFLFAKEDMHWLFESGASDLFPDRWDRFVSVVPFCERSSILNAYYRRLTSDNEEEKLTAAKHFVEWEMSISRLRPDFKAIAKELEKPEFVLPFARAECHYFVHQGWFRSDTHLLDDCKLIQHIPTHIVHGRYDIVCRPRMAWQLHKALPLSSIEFTWDSGHSVAEKNTIDSLIRATDRFRDLDPATVKC